MSYRSEGQLYPGYTYLTSRQAEVLRLSFEGLDNRSIAVSLHLSYERVRHIKQIMRYKTARGAFGNGTNASRYGDGLVG